MTPAFLIIITTVCFYAFFYQTVIKRWRPLVGPLLERAKLFDSHPVRHVDAVGKLAAAALAQGFFAATLLVICGVDVVQLVDGARRFELVILGFLLGAAEIALASLLCRSATQVLLFAAPRRASDWLGEGRAGWMSYFWGTKDAAPIWMSTAIIAFYVGGEEVIFRAILINLLRDYGEWWAVCGAGGLFVIVQTFSMPSVRAALYPMVGATVVGLVHGIVFFHVPILLPLVVAHLTFFMGATLFFQRSENQVT